MVIGRSDQGEAEEMKITDLIFGHTEFKMPAKMWAHDSGDLPDLKQSHQHGGIIKDSRILRKVGRGPRGKVKDKIWRVPTI